MALSGSFLPTGAGQPGLHAASDADIPCVHNAEARSSAGDLSVAECIHIFSLCIERHVLPPLWERVRVESDRVTAISTKIEDQVRATGEALDSNRERLAHAAQILATCQSALGELSQRATDPNHLHTEETPSASNSKRAIETSSQQQQHCTQTQEPRTNSANKASARKSDFSGRKQLRSQRKTTKFVSSKGKQTSEKSKWEGKATQKDQPGSTKAVSENAQSQSAMHGSATQTSSQREQGSTLPHRTEEASDTCKPSSPEPTTVEKSEKANTPMDGEHHSAATKMHVSNHSPWRNHEGGKAPAHDESANGADEAETGDADEEDEDDDDSAELIQAVEAIEAAAKHSDVHRQGEPQQFSWEKAFCAKQDSAAPPSGTRFVLNMDPTKGS